MSEDTDVISNNRFSIPKESAAPTPEPTPKYRQKVENFADKEETVKKALDCLFFVCEVLNFLTILVEDFCGNKRIQVSTYEEDGATWPVYQEHCTNKDYYVSECDGNSFNSPSTASALSIGQVYNQNGFRCTPASHPHREKQGVVDILRDMFALDKSRKHINERIGRDVPEVAKKSGAPAIYMFNHCKNIESEIVGWIEDPKTGKARDADDHLISCMCFMVCKPRRYMGDYMLEVSNEPKQVRRAVDPYSKY